MWLEIEDSLKAAIAGAVPTAKVFGSMEFVDMASEDAPPLAVLIQWAGFDPSAQKQDAIAGAHEFRVLVIADALRIKPTERRNMDAGLAELYRRLIAWRPRPALPDSYAEMESARVLDPGRLWTYEIVLNVSGYKIRSQA